MKILKSVLSVAVVAAGTSFATAGSANAGSSFGIYIGNGGGHHHHRGYRHRGGGFSGGGFIDRPIIHKQPRHHRGGFCGPRRALNKAFHMGLYQPHIQRVNKRAIAVVGYKRGYPAKVVFKRHSKHCKVLKTRGFH